MIESIVIGLIAALTVGACRVVQETSWFAQLIWVAPSFLLGVACFSVVFQYFFFGKKSGSQEYDGLADIFIHVHSPAALDSALRWAMRGMVSFWLAVFGGNAGVEGSATEFAHSFAIRVRSRTSRWFEARRRTDASSSLAAGVAAAFGTPFAAVLLPMELELGGRVIFVGISSIVAFLSMRFLGSLVSLHTMDLTEPLLGFKVLTASQWLWILAIGILSGAMGIGMIHGVRYFQNGLLGLFKNRPSLRTLTGGLLLFALATIYKAGNIPSWNLLEQVLHSSVGPSQSAFLFCSEFLALAIVLAGFGTLGVFWPLFALGGFFATMLLQFHGGETQSFTTVAALSGGASFLGAVLGVPLSGALLAFEISQNLFVLLVCLVAGFTAREVRRRLWTPTLTEIDLKARGLSLLEGRSQSVLESILVKDAMIIDHEIVHEHEPVSDLYMRLLNSRYPFLPVVNTQGVYLGILTVDMVQEAWQAQGKVSSSNSTLSRLLEAKDLLYRSGFKPTSVKPNDRLTASAGMFHDIPCVPVLSEDGRILGLLFVHHVRLAYDREVARRSLVLSEQDS